VQGEGTHVGESTLFVRFGGCDLRCAWCDSPQTWRPAAECSFELERGSGRFRARPNPVALDEVLAAAERLGADAHRFVSLTGGEPLLQPDAVLALARALRARGPRIYLETHGLAADALEQVIDAVDVVAMDWKLASDVRRAGQATHDAVDSFHDLHERFLRVARRAPEVVIKVVVTPASGEEELDELCARIAGLDAEIPLVLQPVTPFGPVTQAPDPERLLHLLVRFSRHLRHVRLIPQTHKTIGAR
jgi:organic radical activating enzyme